jgi:hypothetical protein
VPDVAPERKPAFRRRRLAKKVLEKLSSSQTSVRRSCERPHFIGCKLQKTKLMSTPTKLPEYLLLIRGTDWDEGLSPEQIQEVMGRFMGWLDNLTEQGKLKGAQPLEPEGKVVSGKNGRVVADGLTRNPRNR